MGDWSFSFFVRGVEGASHLIAFGAVAGDGIPPAFGVPLSRGDGRWPVIEALLYLTMVCILVACRTDVH